jgi:hypothetical protein
VRSIALGNPTAVPGGTYPVVPLPFSEYRQQESTVRILEIDVFGGNWRDGEIGRPRRDQLSVVDRDHPIVLENNGARKRAIEDGGYLHSVEDPI